MVNHFSKTKQADISGNYPKTKIDLPKLRSPYKTDCKLIYVVLFPTLYDQSVALANFLLEPLFEDEEDDEHDEEVEDLCLGVTLMGSGMFFPIRCGKFSLAADPCILKAARS